MQDVSADTLKLVLSEVLRDLRQAEKCYIKYELKQGCSILLPDKRKMNVNCSKIHSKQSENPKRLIKFAEIFL